MSRKYRVISTISVLHYVNEIVLYLRHESQRTEAQIHLKDDESSDFEMDSMGEASQNSKSKNN